MVQYIYEKYNANFNSGYYYASQTSSNNYPAGSSYSFSGYSGYSIVNGNFVGSGSAAYAWPVSGSVYNGSGSSFSQTTTSGGTTTITNYSIYYSGSYYSQGTRIGQVFAEDGSLPANGQHSDGFYYVRRYVATPPTVITPNGGEVWNNAQTITWSNSQTGLKYRIEISKNNGQSWTVLVAETAVDATSYTHNFLNESEANLAKIRVTGINNGLFTISDESNGVFAIQHNVAPFTPALLEPIGIKKNVENIIRFVWKHNDTDAQSKAEIRIREQGTLVWLEEQTVIGSQQETYALVDAGIAPANVEWQVRTYDQQNLVSPWSNIGVFTVGFPTAEPVITTPLISVSTSRPIIEWTSPAQVAYQIVITDVGNVVLWDTGEITSTIKSRTSGVDFINGATYRINVRTKDAGGIFSDYVQSEVITAYTPPAKSIVTVFDGNGLISFNIEMPTPTGTQPSVTSHEVYKRINNVWMRIATGVNTAFNDYHVRSGQEYEYYVKALGDNDTSVNSDIVSQTITLNGSWIHAIQDAGATLQYFQYNGTGYEDSFEPESAVLKFAGRTRPVVHFGAYEDYSLTVTIQSVEGMSDMDVLRSFTRNREAIVYRDGDGNLIVGYLLSLVTSKEYRVSSATITIVETDFTEGV